MGLGEPIDFDPSFPDPQETELAKEARDKLISYLKPGEKIYEIELSTKDGLKEKIKIPSSALNFFFEILKQMARGSAVTLIPNHAQLTTQEAANFLNVSRPYLIKLLDKKVIPHSKVGRHRRVAFDDILKYKNSLKIESRKAREELTKDAQNLDLGY